MGTNETYAVPDTLSPSRVSSYTQCPLQFRFVSIQGLPDPPSIHTTKGTIVHRALEILFDHPPAERTVDAALTALDATRSEFADSVDYVDLGLDIDQTVAFWDDASKLVRRYFEIENPTEIVAEGRELRLEARLGDFVLRGIIDRLERAPDGSLVVSDYKTGKSPPDRQSQARMNPMMLYAWLCLQHFGSIPSSLRLLYLRDGVVHHSAPTPQSVEFHAKRATAVWQAIATSCRTGVFRPNKSALCKSCAYQQWCPEFGGNPERAADEAPLTIRGRGR